MLPDNTNVSTRGQRVVVAGATAGIGFGVALQFAKTGAEVWIVGRNPKKGDDVLEKLKQAAPTGVTPAPEFRFFQADLSLISETVRVAHELADAAGEAGIDHLILTQGGPAVATDVAPNAEGLDTHFATQLMSRFVLAHHLTLVRCAVKRSVVSVALAGNGRKEFDVNDITLEALKKSGRYTLLRVAPHDCTVIDAVWQELAERNPSIRFLSLHPGFVRTPALENPAGQPLLLRIVFVFGRAFMAKTIDEYAQVPFYLVANPEGQKLVGTEAKATQWDDKARRLSESPALKTPGTREAIWNFMVGKLPK
ncbi:NAD(P)-binding protein [Exidia glandulosa HHB12029]|uniref:NAD(P)-binding protein n=1 Tax=Exidia glandulosa HHB12029 TaxID=1314781 RepID=A0A165DJV4_EXIGL|nr:NAD(P)-binding protein [Exidia glandulosa HHB12029]